MGKVKGVRVCRESERGVRVGMEKERSLVEYDGKEPGSFGSWTTSALFILERQT
jgi:hypothetical protein